MGELKLAVLIIGILAAVVLLAIGLSPDGCFNCYNCSR
ncbi:hypothetical protein LEY_1 [Paenibacillus phage Ley]|uniref:Uncharacterized protein n=3 Tax=Halcyonevirus C7Cdelta TaxID=2845733 RepID=A0A345ASF8_9CAUD|nr:hypothetical protein KMD17_gp01 [Paenibacillus phage C7Cdelta]AXF39762.1 hypothetical protein C7CDELTA_1 [Paenibacillus phage C7Cdelta]AXF39928.1 hypothetical protein ASH_1 [Paenibacillus phage Ash]AXF40215.1 hypothetical protein LEY_1 [Paenibacillus phage Ley]ETK27972.1 hypothetical protein ERIC1_1c14270 [Paenibacillus larvae subsp. larvae DSM 25719]